MKINYKLLFVIPLLCFIMSCPQMSGKVRLPEDTNLKAFIWLKANTLATTIIYPLSDTIPDNEPCIIEEGQQWDSCVVPTVHREASNNLIFTPRGLERDKQYWIRLRDKATKEPISNDLLLNTWFSHWSAYSEIFIDSPQNFSAHVIGNKTFYAIGSGDRLDGEMGLMRWIKGTRPSNQFDVVHLGPEFVTDRPPGSCFAWGDVDKDGMIDLVIGNSYYSNDPAKAPEIGRVYIISDIDNAYDQLVAGTYASIADAADYILDPVLYAPDNSLKESHFGSSCVITDDYLLIGRPGKSCNAGVDLECGAVELFKWDAGLSSFVNWGLELQSTVAKAERWLRAVGLYNFLGDGKTAFAYVDTKDPTNVGVCSTIAAASSVADVPKTVGNMDADLCGANSYLFLDAIDWDQNGDYELSWLMGVANDLKWRVKIIDYRNSAFETIATIDSAAIGDKSFGGMALVADYNFDGVMERMVKTDKIVFVVGDDGTLSRSFTVSPTGFGGAWIHTEDLYYPGLIQAGWGGEMTYFSGTF